MTMRSVALGISLLLLGLFTACAAPADEKTPSGDEAPSTVIEVTDQLGRAVRLEKVPQTIISIAPSNTEILFALGLGDQVVAVTDYCDYPAEAKEKTSLGSYITPSMEDIVAISPDLILATSVHEEEVISALEKIGMTVLALDPKTMDEVMESIALVGQVTGRQEEAAQVVSGMRARVKAVTDKTNNLADTERPRVFYAVWYEPLMSAGAETFQDDLIGIAGGNNVAGNLTGWITIGLETVVEADPEVMIAGVNFINIGDLNYQFIETEPRLRDTQARLNNRVFEVDSDLVSRTGPRIVDGLEKLAQFIHPELFK